MKKVFLFLLTTTTLANAAPPDFDSPDWDIMKDFTHYFNSQYSDDQKQFCCTIADGRPVQAFIDQNGNWKVHITPDHFKNAQDHWLIVPDSKILRKSKNPVGLPIVWYNSSTDQIYCFAPPNGV